MKWLIKYRGNKSKFSILNIKLMIIYNNWYLWYEYSKKSYIINYLYRVNFTSNFIKTKKWILSIINIFNSKKNNNYHKNKIV